MINIGKPYIVEESINNTEWVSLCSDITYKNETKTLFFRVGKEWGGYLCAEKADAFLMAVLPLSLWYGDDIVCDAPVSEKLYWNLMTGYIPAMHEANSFFHSFSIECDTDAAAYCGKAVGTALSCGVDSFYTVLSNLNRKKTENFNITHITFFNAGACGYFGGEEARKLFFEKTEKYGQVAKDMGLEFVAVDSNISEYLMMDFDATNTFRNFAVVFALQKLFGMYYYSSGTRFGANRIDPKQSTNYDLLNCYAFSNENVQFFSVGADKKRVEKIEWIADYPITYDLLNVCDHGYLKNCGDNCIKCIRTQIALYSIGKLDLYKNVFDVEKFKKNKEKYFAKLIAISPYKTAEGVYVRESIRKCKEHGVPVPYLSYVIAIPGWIKYSAIAIASKIKPLRALWHRIISKRDNIRFGDM